MSIKTVLSGIIIYCLFSLSSVFMKLASSQNYLIYKLILFSLSIGVLGIFSLLWQRMLSKLNLNKAYYFKSTTLIWGLIYGVLIFGEKITINMIIGIIISLLGVVLILGDGKHE